jgi:hypothetical protein
MTYYLPLKDSAKFKHICECESSPLSQVQYPLPATFRIVKFSSSETFFILLLLTL